MALALFLAEATPLTLLGGATALELKQAFERAAPASRSFGWQGPAPRVTRRSDGGAFVTRAAWLGAWPPDTANLAPPMRATAAAVAESLRRELDARGYFGGPWSVTWYPYNAAQHGTLAWWRDGRATQTRTRDQFPEFAGRLGEQDNPVGPTTPETRPQTAGEVAGEALGGASGAAKGLGAAKDVLIIAAVIAVPLAVAWGLSSVRGIAENVAIGRARSNPVRRGRR